MNNLASHTIEDTLEDIQKKLLERFQHEIKAIVLYGSWAKGTAKEYSDVDLLVVFDKLKDNIRKLLYEIERDTADERSITLLPALVEDFHKEKIPLYTAAKKEGRIIWGDVDLTINPENPRTKYADAFERSKEFETKKVDMAVDILKEYPSYGSADLCFVASKHAIQMALAMKGIGYSSKVVVLLPLTKKYLGKEIALIFRKLFKLYIKSEYEIEFLTEEELKLVVEYAKKILGVYTQFESQELCKT